MKTFLLLIALSLSFHVSGQALEVNKKDLQHLYEYMSGEFSSEEQSKTDSTFYAVKLWMIPVWQGKSEGCWLYVEQAMMSASEKPYRQRMYHLFLQDDTTIIAQIYDVKNPKQYAGAWENHTILKNLTRDSLIDRKGCGIFLHKQNDNSFSGATPGRDCLSSLRGSTYATSEIIISPENIKAWDRGWDQYGHQVWGVGKGPYVFVKTKHYKT